MTPVLKRPNRRGAGAPLNVSTFLKTHLLWVLMLAAVLPPAAPAAKIDIQAPASPAAIPLILAAANLPEANLRIFTSHTQAHALFLNDQAPILATGLAAGVRFFRQGVPVRIVNSYVSGLTYVVADFAVEHFRDLRGRRLLLPFAGSPIEEVTRFFMSREGLQPQRDIPVGYAGFPSAVRMLQEGRIHAAVLPEPFVAMALENPALRVTLSYQALWQRHTGRTDGYPQVGTFVKAPWAATHAELLQRLNTEIARAIIRMQRDPADAVGRAAAYLPFPPGILPAALKRTAFQLLQGPGLKQSITDYYTILGVPLDATFEDFF